MIAKDFHPLGLSTATPDPQILVLTRCALWLWLELPGSSVVPCFSHSDFVHDALPTLGTTSAVSVIKNLVLSGEAGETEADIWFTSISFIASPTREMLAEVKVRRPVVLTRSCRRE